MYTDLKERIKEHEGYCETVYKDTLGFETGGYGHKIIPGEDIPTDRAGWDALFESDFQNAVDGATRILMAMILMIQLGKLLLRWCSKWVKVVYLNSKNALSHLKEQRYTEFLCV